MGKLEVETPPVFRLPEWNDLSNAQRRDLVREAEEVQGAHDCAVLAAVMYAKIRDLVQVEPPPLMIRLHGGGAAPGLGGGPEPIETAPRDGTMLRLLVDYSGKEAAHPLDDTAGLAWTIGFNNDANLGPDEGEGWKFAGWCWAHDHFTQGQGRVVGWRHWVHGECPPSPPRGNGQ